MKMSCAVLWKFTRRHTISLKAAQSAIALNWAETPVRLIPIRAHHYPEGE